MAEPTPGPWEPDANGYGAIHIGQAEKGWILANVRVSHASPIPEEEAWANARLMAAAPELLRIAEFWDRFMSEDHDPDRECKGDDRCLHCDTRRVIEKARGKQ